MDVRETPEQVHAVDGDAMSDADEADVAARSRCVKGLVHGLLGADGFDDGVGAEAVSQLLDRGDALVAARLDDVYGAELARQTLSGFVAAHSDDPLRPELLGRQHGEQPDSSVTDDSDGLTWPGFRGDGAEPAGAEDVRGGDETGDAIVGGMSGVATRVPSARGTRSRSAWAPRAP